MALPGCIGICTWGGPMWLCTPFSVPKPIAWPCLYTPGACVRVSRHVCIRVCIRVSVSVTVFMLHRWVCSILCCTGSIPRLFMYSYTHAIIPLSMPVSRDRGQQLVVVLLSVLFVLLCACVASQVVYHSRVFARVCRMQHVRTSINICFSSEAAPILCHLL